MGNTPNNTLTFSESLADLDAISQPNQVVHIVCIAGSFSFTFNHVRYNVCPSDYIIFTVGALYSRIEWSADCRVLMMAFHESVSASIVFNSNYGILGHLSLLSNPVIHLSAAEFDTCLTDLRRLCQRAAETQHLFHDELISTLLKAHILDLYDIHARKSGAIDPDSRIAALMRQFIGMLIAGDFLADRSLDYYADKLCITPHYLSEVSKKTSGQPASYWINQFVLKSLVSLVMDKTLSMEEIAARLHFSSVSYLTRYLKKQLGMTPSELRRGQRAKF